MVNNPIAVLFSLIQQSSKEWDLIFHIYSTFCTNKPKWIILFVAV